MNFQRRRALKIGTAAVVSHSFLRRAWAQPKRAVKIGQTMPYSGPVSASGTIGKLHRAYFEKINDEGGIGGTRIELISVDDGYNPAKTVEQVRGLVERENVDALFQTSGTACNSAIHNYVNARKVPHLFVLSGSSKWNDPSGHPYTFAFNLSYLTEGEIYGKYILRTRPDSRIAILYQNDDYGRDLLAGLERGLAGGKPNMIVGRATYETTDPTVDSQVVSLKASGADVVVIATAGKFSALAIRRVYDIGWRPLVILNNVAASVGSVLVPAGLDKSKGIVTVQYWKDEGDPAWRNDPAMLEWRGFMGKNYTEGNVADANNIYAYITAQLLVHVLRQCRQDYSRENITAQAAGIVDYHPGLLLPGISMNTTPKDHAPIKQARLCRFDGSKWALFGELIGSAQPDVPPNLGRA